MGVADVTPVDSIRSEMMAHREEERLVSPGDDGSPGAGFFLTVIVAQDVLFREGGNLQ